MHLFPRQQQQHHSVRLLRADVSNETSVVYQIAPQERGLGMRIVAAPSSVLVANCTRCSRFSFQPLCKATTT